MPYEINSTERGLSKTLLDIRGVKQPSIKGKGNVEADFAGTIKATVTQSSGTDIVERTNPDSRFLTHRFNKLGTICSDAYAAKANRLYPIVPGTLGYDFSRLPSKKISLINEKVELTAHSSGLDDHDAQAATVVEQHGTRSSKTVPIFEADPVAKSSSRTDGTTVKKQ